MSRCYVLHELPIGVTLGASSEAKVPPVPGPSLSAAPYLSPLHLLPDTPSVLPHMSGGGNDACAYVQGEVNRVEVMGKCIGKLFMLVWHMCMCACVCVYGRMHDMHVRARAHMRACMHVHACAHVHMCKNVEVKG